MTDAIDFFAIAVEQVDWDSQAQLLTDIRHRVFVEEQDVPVAEELDGRDAEASHWLARNAQGDAMGCARLLGNQVGRMAVLAEYRHRGVGTRLLQAIIEHAVEHGLDNLTLAAQTPAIPFYRRGGFRAEGEEFFDAGMPHYRMTLGLARFKNPRPSPPPPAVSDEDRIRDFFEGAAPFRGRATALVAATERTLRVFSDSLDPLLYDDSGLCDAVVELASRHPFCQVYILVRDSSQLGRQFHRLVATHQRLTSSIHLRKLNPERDSDYNDFVVADETGVLRLQEPERYQGFSCRYDPAEARRLGNEFDALWESSLPDPDIRQLTNL